MQEIWFEFIEKLQNYEYSLAFFFLIFIFALLSCSEIRKKINIFVSSKEEEEHYRINIYPFLTLFTLKKEAL